MEVRTVAQRVIDAKALLASEVDIWVASANADGEVHLIPLSYYWDGEQLTVATPERSRTARNLRRAGNARMALGPTRNAVILEGPVEVFPVSEDNVLAEVHAQAAGFDARETDEPYVFIRLTPQWVQHWRTVEELPDRIIMRDGVWLG